MTRKKVKLVYIANDSARKATFKKRKKGLMKKVSELSTLCGIETCAIIYSPYDTEPEVWPSPLEVQRTIAKFKNMPDMDQSKKMVNQESFLRQRITKAQEQLKKMKRDNREKEITQVMYNNLIGEGLQNLSMVDLSDLGWLIEQNTKEIEEKIKTLQQKPPAPPPKVMTKTSHHVERSTGENDEAVAAAEAAKNTYDMGMDATVQNQQWLMELLKSNDNIGFARNEELLPFSFNNNNGLWSNFSFP